MDYPIVPLQAPGSSLPLRRHFWQVAEDSYDLRFISPFQEKRIEAELTPQDVADLMKVDVEAYIRMENGQLCHDSDNILSFCDAVGCHPLDLYRSKRDNLPLPPEIFESLIVIVTSAYYSRGDKKRAADILDKERRRAQFVLERNMGEVDPLRRALGYNPVMPDHPIPYYLPESLRQEDIWRLRDERPGEPLFVSAMRFLGHETPRMYLELCLNAYQLDRERNRDLHAELARGHAGRRGRIERVLSGLSLQLYGPHYASFGIESLKKLIHLTEPKDVQEAFKQKFLEKPDLTTPLLDPDHVDPVKVRLFFKSIVESCRIDAMYAKSDPDLAFKRAQRDLDDLVAWRNSVWGRKMMDWFEHWVIADILERPQIDSALLARPGRRNRPGPPGIES